MYAGTTFRDKSGGFIGVHQKIDRVARIKLSDIIDDYYFPDIKQILHFEGNNGPDGIKRKSPSVDEPWHFIDPTKPDDMKLRQMITDHIDNLSNALKTHDEKRASFEAAWLSHAVSDGLTPAHHFPLSDKIEQLWGRPKEDRLSVIDKNIIKGKNKRDTVSSNWEYWGAKGVFSTHVLFELGVASSIKTYKFSKLSLSKNLAEEIEKNGFDAYFTKKVQEIFALNMYERYWKSGWTNRIARETRQVLLPEIITAVSLAWYAAVLKANQ